MTIRMDSRANFLRHYKARGHFFLIQDAPGNKVSYPVVSYLCLLREGQAFLQSQGESAQGESLN